jgi:hypothetical protein
MERLSILHAAGTCDREQARDGDFTLGASASEADLAPLHGAPERSLGAVVGRLHALVAEKGKEPFKDSGVIRRRPSLGHSSAIRYSVPRIHVRIRDRVPIVVVAIETGAARPRQFHLRLRVHSRPAFHFSCPSRKQRIQSLPVVSPVPRCAASTLFKKIILRSSHRNSFRAAFPKSTSRPSR